MNINTFILLLSLIGCAFCQIEDTSIVIGDTLITSKEFYKTGVLARIAKYKNGKRHMEQIEYYENKQKKRYSNYLDGCLKDTAFRFFENGKILQISTYKNCKENGIRLVFSETQDTILKAHFLDGHHIGFHEEYSAKGKPKEFTHYDSLGRKQGLSQHWREDGTRKDSAVFKDDEYVEIREYFDNGTLRQHEWYKAPMILDSAVYYAPDGKNKSVVKNGNGEVLMFSENRKQIFGMKIENGKTLWTRPIEDAIKK